MTTKTAGVALALAIQESQDLTATLQRDCNVASEEVNRAGRVLTTARREHRLSLLATNALQKVVSANKQVEKWMGEQHE